MEETIRAALFMMCHLIASTDFPQSHSARSPTISQVIFVIPINSKIPLILFKEVTTVRGGEGHSAGDSVRETDHPFGRRIS